MVKCPLINVPFACALLVVQVALCLSCKIIEKNTNPFLRVDIEESEVLKGKQKKKSAWVRGYPMEIRG